MYAVNHPSLGLTRFPVVFSIFLVLSSLEFSTSELTFFGYRNLVSGHDQQKGDYDQHGQDRLGENHLKYVFDYKRGFLRKVRGPFWRRFLWGRVDTGATGEGFLAGGLITVFVLALTFALALTGSGDGGGSWQSTKSEGNREQDCSNAPPGMM